MVFEGWTVNKENVDVTGSYGDTVFQNQEVKMQYDHFLYYPRCRRLPGRSVWVMKYWDVWNIGIFSGL